MPTATSNEILAALPAAEWRRLLPLLELVSIESEQVLYQTGERITQVYFPETAVITKLVILEDGSSAEVGMVGKDGVAGLCNFLGSGVSPFRAVGQVGGSVRRMPADLFIKEVRRPNTALNDLLRRYAACFLVQVSHLAACNQLHSVKERCCRMLLSTFDRLGSAEVLFTHDLLAFFLGVRRASIGDVMSELKRARLLTYARGRITLLNRPGLESSACECYRHIRDAGKKMFDTDV